MSDGVDDDDDDDDDAPRESITAERFFFRWRADTYTSGGAFSIAFFFFARLARCNSYLLFNPFNTTAASKL